jgi:hypothetical protein
VVDKVQGEPLPPSIDKEAASLVKEIDEILEAKRTRLTGRPPDPETIP